MYRTFDFPDPAVSSGDRADTTVATQALFMMNSPLVKAECSSLAAKLLADDRITEEDRLERACQSIFSRPAERDELPEWSAFLERYERTARSTGQDPGSCRQTA